MAVTSRTTRRTKRTSHLAVAAAAGLYVVLTAIKSSTRDDAGAGKATSSSSVRTWSLKNALPRLPCIVLQVPVVVLWLRFIAEYEFERATLVGQLVDTMLLLAGLAHALLLVICFALVARKASLATPIWFLVIIGAIFSTVFVVALLTSPVRAEVAVISLAGACSLLAVIVLALAWPSEIKPPLSLIGKAGATTLAGVVSVAGIQAWNTLEFAPSRQEPSITTSADLSAVRDGNGTTRLAGTITVTNVGDVPAVLVGSQYVLWTVGFIDRTWPGPDNPSPLEPEQLGANGASQRGVMDAGIPFRPYARLNPKSEAQFKFSSVIARPESAFRLWVKVFSARADRLFVEEPNNVAPQVHTYEEERGSQLVKKVVEGSRLRAFTRGPIEILATWWHEPSVRDSPPQANVYFQPEDPAARSGEYDKGVREYALVRQFYEITTLVEPEKTSPAPAPS